jgi:TonB family protein
MNVATLLALAVTLTLALASPSVAAGQDSPDKLRRDAEKAFKKGDEIARADTYRDAIEKFQQARDLWKRAGDPAGEARALEHIGYMYSGFEKDHAKALGVFAEALEAARASKDRKLEAQILGDVARAKAATGDLAGGVKSYEEAFAIYELLEDRAGAAFTLTDIGRLYDDKDAARRDEYRKRAAEYRAKYNVPPLTQRVSGGVLAGKAIKKVQPSYPAAAAAAGISGVVVVEVTVSTEGAVESVRVVSGAPELSGAAVEAARQWTFSPTRLSGEPTRVIGTITFNFRRT